MTEPFKHIHASRAGVWAHKCLDGAGAALTVDAVFDRSAYVRDANGNILCLSGRDLPIGPFSLICEPWDRVRQAGLETGQTLVVDGEKRIRAGRALIHTAGAQTMFPPRGNVFSRETARAGLARLRSLLPERLSGKGFAPLLYDVLGVRPARRVDCAVTGAFLDMGREGMRALAASVESVCAGRADIQKKSLFGLIGLGPGLTPSGDDVLGGAFVALHAIGRGGCAHALAMPVLEHARTGTNRISYAYLAAASQGHASALLHDAVGALGSDAPGLENALNGLDRMGHSSGWDSFLGAASILSLAAGGSGL